MTLMDGKEMVISLRLYWMSERRCLDVPLCERLYGFPIPISSYLIRLKTSWRTAVQCA